MERLATMDTARVFIENSIPIQENWYSTEASRFSIQKRFTARANFYKTPFDERIRHLPSRLPRLALPRLGRQRFRGDRRFKPSPPRVLQDTQYSRGQLRFYAIPPLSTIERWMAESEDGFRFCPKFPKAISHERRLIDAETETAAFIKILDSLAHGNRLGPSFLQLPPSFNANSYDQLKAFLQQLPKDFEYAVEARHVSWYDKGDNEQRLDDLLSELGMDKVIFDSRPLFATESPDDDERSAQSRKPQTPVRKCALSSNPFLRFVGQNDIAANDHWIKEWAPIINKWILEKKQPYIFAHCPNEANASLFRPPNSPADPKAESNPS